MSVSISYNVVVDQKRLDEIVIEAYKEIDKIKTFDANQQQDELDKLLTRIKKDMQDIIHFEITNTP